LIKVKADRPRCGSTGNSVSGVEMSLRTTTIALVSSLLLLSAAGAQVQLPAPADQPQQAVTDVADIMIAAQFRHIKLWFAGKLKNWRLATYELDLMKSKLQEAVKLSPASQSADLTTRPLQSLQDAIGKKDSAGFARAYAELTNACNACHRAVDRAFISIQVPVTSPFSDEQFLDVVADGRALAYSVCGACHVVSGNASEVPALRFAAPSFSSLARRASVTDESLRQLLLSNHRNLGQDQAMPNPRLAEYQIEEIIAYFATLRSGAQQAP
jgi:mono/diheme cytochrome c family protein